MKQIPQIRKYMTTLPHTVGRDIPLNTANGILKEHGIRHLPVQDGGKLVGILTDRDVKLAGAIADPAKLTVEDVMTLDPFTVRPEAAITDVVAEMAEHKYGSAIIVDNGKVVGIFTSIDALRVLGTTLAANYKERT